MKTKKSKTTNNSVFKPTVHKIFALIITLLIIAVIILSVFTYYLWNFSNMASSWHMHDLIVSAQDGLYNLGKQQVTKDPQTGNYSIPAAKLKLNSNEKYIELSAIYSQESSFRSDEENATKYIPAEIYFSNNEARNIGNGAINQNQDNLDKMFKEVPMAQACMKQVIVKIGPLSAEDKVVDGYVLAFNKKLADGREITGFKSTKCTDGSAEFADYLKSAESY